jgi:hypothetical protein
VRGFPAQVGRLGERLVGTGRVRMGCLDEQIKVDDGNGFHVFGRTGSVKHCWRGLVGLVVVPDKIHGFPERDYLDR